MKRAVLWLGSLFAVSSCGLLPCGADDLDIRFVPSEVTLTVGQTQAARVELGACHFNRSLTDRITWTSDDLTIASVDSLSGKITARASGSTTVRARGETYHDLGGVRVTVH